MKPQLLIICNVFDDNTRVARGIKTDSPAASRKVFHLAGALRTAGVNPFVLSLGRGKAGGKLRWFPTKVARINRILTIYAPFSTTPVLSELVSFFSLLPILLRFRKAESKAILFYNRNTAYLPLLLFSTMLKFRRIIDIEDGEVSTIRHGKAAKIRRTWQARLYDQMCTGGALLACSALHQWTTVKRTRCYYGVAAGDEPALSFRRDQITILMGGALLRETGSELFAESLQILRRLSPEWASKLRFEVTGHGEGLQKIVQIADAVGMPHVFVHGRLTDYQYTKLLSRCDVGLALKLNEGRLANTTFPSKVIEYAAAGLLVLTTDISDVRDVLGGDGAIFLQRDDPLELVRIYSKVVEDRDNAKRIAINGMCRVKDKCDPRLAGLALAKFIFESTRATN